MVDVGYATLFAASIFGFMGMMSAFGRVAFGFIADLVTKTTAYALNIACAAVGVTALMLIIDSSQTWLLYLYVIFFGIAFGSRAIILSAISADIFSGRGFGAIFGLSAVSVGIGSALGSWQGGVFHDTTGNYLLSFGLALTLLVLSLVLVWFTGLESIRRFDRRLWPRQ